MITSRAPRQAVPWWLQPAQMVATGFGSGYAPAAPGTFGSLVGLPIAWGASHLALLPHALLIVLLCAAGVPVCGAVARSWGEHDPSRIVWDEVVGIQCALFVVPAAWVPYVVGFVLFRIFDIFKPFPLKWLERLPGGLGIMADDVGAGVYAALVLALISHFLPSGSWTIW